MISTLTKCTRSLFCWPNICRHFSGHQLRHSSTNTSDTNYVINLDERQFTDISIDKFKDVIGGEDKTLAAVREIIGEYEYEKYVTLEVPSTLTTQHMRDLLTIKTPDERRKWFRYLLRRELSKDIQRRQDADRSREFWAKKRQMYAQCNSERTGIWDNEGNLLYGLWHNCIISKIEPKSIKRLYSHRLRRAAIFGPQLVVDMGFDDHMELRDCRSLASKIQKLYNDNKYRCDQPFDIHFTNCDPNKPFMQSLPQYLPNYKSPYFLSTFHSESHVDLFPTKRLVYLSSHARQPLQRYNLDDIYIIGGITGSNKHVDYTASKAQREGIRTFRLPIDEHVLWKCGSKSLSVEIVARILHDLEAGHPMGDSLRNNIPKSYQKSAEDIVTEDQLRLEKYRRHKISTNNHKTNKTFVANCTALNTESKVMLSLKNKS